MLRWKRRAGKIPTTRMKVDGDMRVITPQSGVPQAIEPLQLSNWVTTGEGSSCMQQKTTMPEMLQKEESSNATARRLNFPEKQAVPSPIKGNSEADGSIKGNSEAEGPIKGNSEVEGPTMADVVKNNRAQHLGMKLKFFPPVIKNGVKVVQLNEIEMEKQSRQWRNTLIGYVLGGMPSFKEMQQFVYGVWHFVSTPRVFLHDDGYFIFKFESEDNKNLLFHNGPYTFNSRPMILKEWIPDFKMNKEPLRLVPLWVSFPKLPLQCWTEENLGRLASYLGRPICTDKLTATGDTISYARVLIEMDITQQLPEKPAHEKKEWKVKQTKPKPQEPIAVEEDHSVPTKVQVQRIGKQVVVFQEQRQGNQHEDQCHQEEDLDSDSEESLGINQYSALRWLNKAHKQKEFKDFLLGKKIDLIGCLETRVKQHKAVKIIRKFGNDWEFYIDYTHAPNGRIWVGWRKTSVAVNIRYSTAQLIHCFIEDRQSQFNCELTYVYGYNTTAGRKPLWDQLRNIKGSINGPWILLGDFNTILSSDDRVNGVPVHPVETVDFQNCITDLGMGQVNRKGCQFSWCNKEMRMKGYTVILIGCLDTFKAIVQNVWQQNIEGHCMYEVWQKLKLVEAETK
ncbi:uncharacterized protein [Nicotiana sylvestris]|uniref:uncharacterized protein n=1 Tax=Nicotiana sylvestris TaxID=4096 RepID=UPI00388C7C8D